MSVKNKDSVRQYVVHIAEIRAALAALTEWIDSMPAPDGAGELPTLHYGHISSVSLIATQLQDDLDQAAGSSLWQCRGAQ